MDKVESVRVAHNRGILYQRILEITHVEGAPLRAIWPGGNHPQTTALSDPVGPGQGGSQGHPNIIYSPRSSSAAVGTEAVK